MNQNGSLMKTYPCLTGGVWRTTREDLVVLSPWSGEPVHSVSLAGDPEAEDALSSATRAFETMRKLPAYRRHDILSCFASRIGEREEELATTITAETGKPKALAVTEVQRSRETILEAAGEARRMGGEVIPLDVSKASEGYVGMYRRFPIGPVLAITPFNFPSNLVCHKVGPAIAAGAPVIVRPSSKTPRTALLLGEMLLSAGMPGEAVSVLPTTTLTASKMAADDRIAVLSFTGSPDVGWELKRKAGRKKVCLELGGNGATIVHSDADLDRAAGRIVMGGFTFSGQVCISVQRVFVHRPVLADLLERLTKQASLLVPGDPTDSRTGIGPLISPEATGRVLKGISDAVAGGARAVTGGGMCGRCVEPTILIGTTPEMDVNRTEIFGPVITVTPYDSFDEAVKRTNASVFGLQAGVFTQDINRMLAAYEEISCGGVIVNDVPTFRMDHMPYGGFKGSGTGKEGPKYAIREMTEGKILVIRSDTARV